MSNRAIRRAGHPDLRPTSSRAGFLPSGTPTSSCPSSSRRRPQNACPTGADSGREIGSEWPLNTQCGAPKIFLGIKLHKEMEAAGGRALGRTNTRIPTQGSETGFYGAFRPFSVQQTLVFCTFKCSQLSLLFALAAGQVRYTSFLHTLSGRLRLPLYSEPNRPWGTPEIDFVGERRINSLGGRTAQNVPPPTFRGSQQELLNCLSGRPTPN